MHLKDKRSHCSSLGERELSSWIRRVGDRAMEDPLLPSSSSSGSGTRRRRGRADGPEGLSSQESGAVNVLVGRRVGAITSGNKYEKAAAMVDQVHTSLCLSLCPSVYVAPVSVGTWPFSATKKLGQFSSEFQECRSTCLFQVAFCRRFLQKQALGDI